eukprot:CAMPEP_0170508592 /NCGR_PEP_ID=MMETSP0208-20121228/62837_1 /TAXON_ID=197538 /ORGANISM="Strombidium inclinatum, Strain S3" /LENGTH=36 /DNA_ID= /DNA_START= /DNA_END= /DNA_ORIENTATION=
MLNFDLNSWFSTGKMDDDRIMEMRDELKRVHLKYIS